MQFLMCKIEKSFSQLTYHAERSSDGLIMESLPVLVSGWKAGVSDDSKTDEMTRESLRSWSRELRGRRTTTIWDKRRCPVTRRKISGGASSANFSLD